jgi:hypothetical protein
MAAIKSIHDRHVTNAPITRITPPDSPATADIPTDTPGYPIISTPVLNRSNASIEVSSNSDGGAATMFFGTLYYNGSLVNQVSIEYTEEVFSLSNLNPRGTYIFLVRGQNSYGFGPYNSVSWSY